MVRNGLLVVLLCIGVMAPLGHAQTKLDDKYFDSKGVKIHYIDVGRGEPIVLIHGFSGSVETSWGNTGVIDGLSKDFRVIALDCRGHGKSDKPHDPKQYGNLMVEDVANLLDHLEIRKAHIVGYSMGGQLTVKFMTMHQDRILTATIGGASGRRGWTAQNQRDSDQLATSLEQEKGFRPLILRLAPPNEPKPSDEAIERQSREMLGRNDALALAAVTRGNREQVVTDDQLKAVRAPLLAVVGSADPGLPGVQALKTLLPALQMVVVEGASHGGERGAARRPEFVKSVRDLIAAHRAVTN